MTRILNKVVTVLLCGTLFLPASLTNPAQASGFRNSVRSSVCYTPYVQQQLVYRDRYIFTPQVQQYITVPVQPYYASWNQLYGTVPTAAAIQQPYQQQQLQQGMRSPQPLPPTTTANDPRFESPYLTREEFLAGMQDIVQAIQAGGGGPQPIITPGVSPKIVAMVRTHCASCHSAEQPSGKWAGSPDPVILWDRGQLADNINWDRVALVTLIGKMPKDGKLTQPEINEFVHHAANFKNGGGPNRPNGNGSGVGGSAPPPPNGSGNPPPEPTQPPAPDVDY